MSTDEGKEGRRVFVLVDKDKVRGVFLTWESADNFAEKHRFSIDRLMEYETAPGHPDDLFLMATKQEGGWEFAGRWEPLTLSGDPAPRRVRLDHYRFQHGVFVLARQRDFPWTPELLAKLDPMNPDALEPRAGGVTAPSMPGDTEKWRPELDSLKPPPPRSTQPSAPPRPEVPKEKHPAGNQLPSEKPPRTEGAAPQPESEKAGEGVKRKPLTLRPSQSKEPKSIPVFKPGSNDSVPPSESMAEPVKAGSRKIPSPMGSDPDLYEELEEAFAEEEETTSAFPFRLVLALLALLGCWSYGIYQALEPAPSLAERISSLELPDQTQLTTIEPDRILLAFPLSPTGLQQWVRRLDLDAIPMGQSFVLPKKEILEQWPVVPPDERLPRSREGFVEWSEQAFLEVSSGYFRETPSGGIWILDREAMQLRGWITVTDLEAVF